MSAILPDMATTFGGEIKAQWVVDPTSVPAPVNQFLVQLGSDLSNEPNEVVLTLGYLNPPLVNVDGSQEEITAAMAASVFPVLPAARVTMSRNRLIELHSKITEVLAATSGPAEG